MKPSERKARILELREIVRLSEAELKQLVMTCQHVGDDYKPATKRDEPFHDVYCVVCGKVVG